MAGTVTRYPRYASFLVTGGVVGLLVTVVLVLGPGQEVESQRRLFFYLSVLLVGVGALLGGLVAVLIEERRRHSGKSADRRDSGKSADRRDSGKSTDRRAAAESADRRDSGKSADRRAAAEDRDSGP